MSGGRGSAWKDWSGFVLWALWVLSWGLIYAGHVVSSIWASASGVVVCLVTGLLLLVRGLLETRPFGR